MYVLIKYKTLTSSKESGLLGEMAESDTGTGEKVYDELTSA